MADITYVPTTVGFLYLAVVLVLWQAQDDGLQPTDRRMGYGQPPALGTGARRPGDGRHLAQAHATHIHHSDQGSQYTSLAFGSRCQDAGVRPSMGSVGDAYENAMAESFFSTLECELLARRRFRSQAEARIAIFSYIEGFYNPLRRHSALNYRLPVAHEKETAQGSSIDALLSQAP